MTLGHSTVDLAIHPENTSKTIEVQRGYYSWWDLNKYKLEAFYWGPLGHIGGIVPFILASNAKFNTLRSGGLFNEWAMLTSKQSQNSQSGISSIYKSQIKPDLQNMELLEVTDFNKEKAERKAVSNNNLASLQDGVYLLKVSENNSEKLIPYIKNSPETVEEKDIIKSEINNILNLKINQEELLAVNIFDDNKNLIKSVSQEQYMKDGGINLNTIDSQNLTFEITTRFYNLQFKKQISELKTEDTVSVIAQNNQIIVKAKNGIKNISIYSISGDLIQNQEVNSSQFESNTIKTGVYVVQVIQNDGKTFNKKVKL
jgi:hypothetical protein